VPAINTLEKIATKLVPCRNYFNVLIIFFVAVIFYQLVVISPVVSDESHTLAAQFYDVPSLLAVVWLMLLNLLIGIYAQSSTQKLDEKHSKFNLFASVRKFLKRVCYIVITIIFIGLSLTILILSVRLLLVWL